MATATQHLRHRKLSERRHRLRHPPPHRRNPLRRLHFEASASQTLPRTVFFGGGTPPTARLRPRTHPAGSHRRRARPRRSAEVTTEANPDSNTLEDLQTLKDGGFTRVSFRHAVRRTRGATGTRPHSTRPQRARRSSSLREVGLQVSVDLGLPGRACTSGEQSVRASNSHELTTFPRTADCGGRHQACCADPPRRIHMPGRRPHGGHVPARRGATHQSRIHLVRGLQPLRSEDTRSDHDLAYWRNQDWWASAPRALARELGTRRNVKHPVPHAQKVRGSWRRHARCDTATVLLRRLCSGDPRAWMMRELLTVAR